MLALSLKPLKKIAGTDGQAGRQAHRQTGRQTDGQDHILSQADGLTKRTTRSSSIRKYHSHDYHSRSHDDHSGPRDDQSDYPTF